MSVTVSEVKKIVESYHCYGCQDLYGEPDNDMGYTSKLCPKCRIELKNLQNRLGDFQGVVKFHKIAIKRLLDIKK